MELLLEVWDHERIVGRKESFCSAPAIVCWVIWRERNAQIFDSEEVALSKILGLVFSSFSSPGLL